MLKFFFFFHVCWSSFKNCWSFSLANLLIGLIFLEGEVFKIFEFFIHARYSCSVRCHKSKVMEPDLLSIHTWMDKEMWYIYKLDCFFPNEEWNDVIFREVEIILSNISSTQKRQIPHLLSYMGPGFYMDVKINYIWSYVCFYKDKSRNEPVWGVGVSLTKCETYLMKISLWNPSLDMMSVCWYEFKKRSYTEKKSSFHPCCSFWCRAFPEFFVRTLLSAHTAHLLLQLWEPWPFQSESF